jgi:flagellar biosynthesis/type III secretory pathway protein FliH
MVLPKGIVALRALPAAPPGPPAGGFALRACELKDLQRRAFERGRAFEREHAVLALQGLLAGLEGAIKALDELRAAERRDVAQFAVLVALAAAEELVGSAVRSGGHDVRGLVDAMLEEALPGIGQGPVEVAVNPDDLGALTGLAGPEAPPELSGRVRVAGDPALPRAACRVRAGGAEILSDPRLRLAAMAERLRAVADRERPDA